MNWEVNLYFRLIFQKNRGGIIGINLPNKTIN
ncbi:hypothetical protein VINI7043_09125 [Vibrio nigripulchritudo ATCC 27043]|nr:hypothetical protein VINI7043_09125 [Vibrio nigripulchritudo ATCC 27043]